VSASYTKQRRCSKAHNQQGEQNECTYKYVSAGNVEWVRIFSLSAEMKVLIITGAGTRAFCSGADIYDMDDNRKQQNIDQVCML